MKYSKRSKRRTNGLYKNGHFICMECVEDIVNWFEEDRLMSDLTDEFDKYRRPKLFKVTNFNVWSEETQELVPFYMVAKSISDVTQFLKDEGTLDDTATIEDCEILIDEVIL